MRKLRNMGSFLPLSAALCLCLSSCNNTVQSTTAQPSVDPAQANLAPVSAQPVVQPYSAAPAQAQPQQPAYSQPALNAPAPEQSYAQSYPGDYAAQADTDAGEPPVYAADPPPPLPEYSQPPAPADNYLWNPGYWGYASSGYYWVPGIWVMAPYVGALWTPPYWGYGGNRYRWHHGYWGSHIGFYGGVNYGYGYVGRGYEGGYWSGRQFNYNRSVNNVNTTIIHNVYNYQVTNIKNQRVSYNGGRGGLNVRPIAAEVTATREQRIAPLPAQVAHMRQAEVNRQQFASVNHGHPAVLAAPAALATSIRAPALRPTEAPGARVLPPMATAAPRQPRPVAVAVKPDQTPIQAARAPVNRPAQHPEPRSNALPPRRADPQRNPREAEPTQPRPNPVPPQRAEPRQNAVPAVRPEPRASPPAARVPARQPEQPHAATRPEARPAPEVRPEQRPPAAPKPEERQHQAAKPGPRPQKEEPK